MRIFKGRKYSVHFVSERQQTYVKQNNEVQAFAPILVEICFSGGRGGAEEIDLKKKRCLTTQHSVQKRRPQLNIEQEIAIMQSPKVEMFTFDSKKPYINYQY